MATLGFESSPNNSKKSHNILDAPQPTSESGQRSISADDIYFKRFVTPWAMANTVSGSKWREFVSSQPIAMVCKETLASSVLGFDWSITATDSNKRDELKGLIKHYTKLIKNGGYYYEFGYEGLIEWLLSDFLDIPFGAGAEVGRQGDVPGGRVKWVKPLDGATLYPTLNKDYPVVQYYNGMTVKFPAHAFARVFMSPRTNIIQEGWGKTPPEKIYFAMEMLSRGDRYYADLLLETPPAGILDLGDMEKDSALEWVKAFREFLAGSPSSFAVPVLYEHTNDVKFLPFGKVPNDIMYDRITLKYAAIVAAAYGMSLSDIGLGTTSSSGETLAGSIRQERKTRRTGIARAKKAIKYFMETIIPDVLQFNIIDPDDEVNVAMGRSRLANATAFKTYREIGMFSEQELRLQALRDGTMSQDFPEAIPDGLEPLNSGNLSERPGLLGSPESAATGGQGEVRVSAYTVDRSKNFESHLKRFVTDVTKSLGVILEDVTNGLSDDEIYQIRSLVDQSLFGLEDALGITEILKTIWTDKNWLRFSYEDNFAEELEKLSYKFISDYLQKRCINQYENGEIDDISAWKQEFELADEKLSRMDWNKLSQTFQSSVTKGAKEFLGKSTAFMIKDLLLSENGIDNGSPINYDKVVEDVYKSLYKYFDEYISTYMGNVTEDMLNKLRNEVLNG